MLTDFFLLTGVALLIVSFYRYNRKSSVPYPPGPTPHILWGNLFDMPDKYEYMKFREWSQEHGPVMRMSIPGKTIIILNELGAAVDLLDKRSSIYSDRPELTMLRDVVRWNWSLVAMDYGGRYKKHRKMAHRGLNTDIEHFKTIQENGLSKESQRLVRNLLREPKNFMDLIEKWGRSTLCRAIYDYDPEDCYERYSSVPKECEEILIRTGRPGTYLVDVFPILQHVPNWFPFTTFKREAKAWRALVEELLESQFTSVIEKITTGIAVRGYISNLIDCNPTTEPEYQAIKETAASMHIAGATSLYSILQAFVLAMTLYPEVQQKAQAEIDSLLEMERVPVIKDRHHLPYVNGLISETLRWSRSIPLGIAHVLKRDDTYNGMLMPAGSIVMANQWSMSRDEKMYDNPDEFIPERFLRHGTRDPRGFVFGFGRRACPGKYFAESALFLAITHILSSLDISKATDENGNEITPVVEYTPSLFCSPIPFKCKISARSFSAID